MAYEKLLDELVGPPLPVDVTMTMHNGAVTANTVASGAVLVPNLSRKKDQACKLISLVVRDENDQGAAIDIYFLSANVSLGATNGAPNISATDARQIMAIVPVLTTDYRDVGTSKQATLSRAVCERVLRAVAGTRDVYVQIMNGAGTPTYSTSGVRLTIGAE